MNRKLTYRTLLFSGFILLFSGVSPNLFVAAQAGYFSMPALILIVLLPAIALLIFTILLARWKKENVLVKTALIGALAGAAATIGLEIVRETGFLLGGMPGELPKLMGVLITNRFAQGPNTYSNFIGWSYHFWNGASFGIVLSVLFGRVRWFYGIVFALFIAAGFLASPATLALGVGTFGIDFGWGFPVTVVLAHVAYGAVFGLIEQKWLPDESGVFHALKRLVFIRHTNLSPKK